MKGSSRERAGVGSSVVCMDAKESRCCAGGVGLGTLFLGEHLLE